MLKLFDISLAQSNEENPRELYYRQEGIVTLVDGHLLLDNATVSFDTFYNCFSYSKYRKYTKLKNLICAFDIEGLFTVRLFCVNQEKAFLIEEKTAESREVAFNVDITALDGEGYLYTEFVSHGQGKILGGGYYTELEETAVKIGIVICTYKREKFLLPNLQQLVTFFDNNENLKDKFGIFVIDNAQTLKQEDLPIGKLFQNKNLGGSGGFTRGIIEVDKRGEFTNILLMDDDIFFDCAILQKVYSILCIANNPEKLCIGGTMLKLSLPYIQHESGARWTGRKLVPNNAGLDMRERSSILVSEKELPVDYTAWWFNCFPTMFVKKFGLPCPFFIKSDDIEYGLRCCEEILVMNGIAVKHEDFDNKYSGENEYYIKRNELILNSLRFKRYGMFNEIKKLFAAVGRQLVLQRYFAVDFIFKAYNHFLRGPKYFNSIKGDELHAELRAMLPKSYTDSELDEMGYTIPETLYHKEKTKFSYLGEVITLNGYLLPDFCYDKKERKNGRFIYVSTIYPSDFYKSKLTVQYDPYNHRGFISRLKRGELFKAGFRLIAVFIKFLFRYKTVSAAYRKQQKVFCSLEEWKKRLDLTK